MVDAKPNLNDEKEYTTVKKIIPVLLVLAVLSLFLASTALARSSAQATGCRRGFTLDLFANHAAETVYPGYLRDLNGDGYICVYNITPTVHRHIDNFIVRSGCRGR